MKPEELRATLNHLSFTIREAASFLGVRERIVYRWLKGEHPVPLSVAKLLQIMVKRKISPETVDRALSL